MASVIQSGLAYAKKGRTATALRKRPLSLARFARLASHWHSVGRSFELSPFEAEHGG